MDNSTTKLARGGDSIYNQLENKPFLRYGVVKALESDSGNKDTGLGRIKVYIKGPISTGGDGDTPDESLASTDIQQLPWCFPLLPKHLQTQPKVGEVVWIFTISRNNEHADRLYLGPIVSQLTLLDKDPFQYSALAGFSFGPQKPNVNPALIPEMKGVFPSQSDISIQGRFNTDITQKKNEVVIRAGKFVTSTSNPSNPYNIKFNGATQTYLQLKYDVVTAPKTDNQPEQRGSVANLVANKINLITLANGSPSFNVLNPDNLISDADLASILATAHQLPFGDVLLQYLRLLKDAVLNHVHNGSGNAATDLTISGKKQAVAAFKAKADELEKAMLSSNVRIN